MTSICQNNKTYHVILTTNRLTVVAQPWYGYEACLKKTKKRKKSSLFGKLLKKQTNKQGNGTSLAELSDEIIKRKELLDLLQVGRECHNCIHPPFPKTKSTISTYNES